MSVKLSAYVWDGCAAAGLKGVKLLIMARLADFSNDDGISYPGVDTIARQTGAGRSTVITAITELQSDGWLVREERRKGNRNKTNLYYLNVKKLREAAAGFYSDSPVSEHSESERSKSECSESERSENTKNTGFDRPESGGDPSVNSKQDPSDNKTSCQPAAQTDAEVEITDRAKQALKHLNLITGSRYQPANSSLENMRARLREGHTLEELQLVIEYKQVHWGDSPKMAEYLRPATLFQPAKFEGYLLSATKWAKSGRPICVNGKWTADGEVEVDTAERDAAYRRFISGVTASKAPTDLEKLVCTEASKASVRGMRSDFAISTWNRIWKECAQRRQGGKSA
ncbi:conserved phage C-terminal domain-containing protein [Rahnella sp. C60]|uniref:conserved phage C-terminal domain-containing protein n=1 Tax=Rahnella perminowiae TaxID=2816244 RepID=UPI001C2806A5|nr:conserved phage C-terminal domain-containing protein [Rahnella perminowiae]MBU9815471.1 conserved phage C-terminal domain-containing protein [Rahnella perminowiae]